jgi:hypothetical protein
MTPPTIQHPVQARRRWTADAVRTLGMTTDVPTAGEILGIGRTKAYEMAKNGDFPVRVLRIGRRYVVPIASLIKLLEVE